MAQNQTSPGLILMNNNEQTINKEQEHFTGNSHRFDWPSPV